MRALRILAIVLATVSLGGCLVGAPEIASEIDIVQWDLRPVDIEESTELHIGRGILGLGSTVAGWTDEPDAELFAEIIDGIDAVHVGAYRLGRHRDTPDDLSFAAREELQDLGWQLVVRTREDFDETVWVFARTAKRHTEMLLVSLEDDELAVVRIDGHPDRLLHAAIRRDDDFLVVAHGIHDEF